MTNNKEGKKQKQPQLSHFITYHPKEKGGKFCIIFHPENRGKSFKKIIQGPPTESDTRITKENFFTAAVSQSAK